MSAAPEILNWPDSDTDNFGLALWTSAEIARATGGTVVGEFECSGVEMDSRDVQEGDLFIALKGENTDGHRFLGKAFEKGAAAAIVDQPVKRSVKWPHVLVADTARALEDLAHAARKRTKAQIIGVTGSVGKTGVKEAIFAALQRHSKGAAHRSVRSYNNHVGVPLSLARMPAASRFGVFEMGMNNKGEISALARQVRPNVAVITTIAPAHIENLGSEEAIADAKAEIFSGLEPGGTAVIPADSAHFDRLRSAALAKGAKILSFGEAKNADVRLLDAVPASGGGSLVTASLKGRILCYRVMAEGRHWVANSLCVMAAVYAAGGDLGAAGLALAELDGLKGRGQRHVLAVPGGQAVLIDESYNANPASMRATLAQLGETPAARRIAVLGSMKELGDQASSFHSELARSLVAADVDFAILVGEEMHSLVSSLDDAGAVSSGKSVAFVHCANAAEAIAALEQYGLAAGDAVLVKGSNSVGLDKLIAHFATREG